MLANLKPMSSAPTGVNFEYPDVELILAHVRDDGAGDYGFISIYYDNNRGLWLAWDPFIDRHNHTLIDLDDLDGWIPIPSYQGEPERTQNTHLSLSARLKKVINEHYAATGEQLINIEANWISYCGTKKDLKNISFTLTNQ